MPLTCTELNTKFLKNNYNPDNHVRPFDCGICFVETTTVLDTPRRLCYFPGYDIWPAKTSVSPRQLILKNIHAMA